jgi:hypothetical protein
VVTATLLAALVAVLLVAMTACSASGVLSGYVGAVKRMNMEKAATYVDGDLGDISSTDDTDEVAVYAYKKTVGSFSYKVVSKEEKKNDAGEVVSTTIKISYSAYSFSGLYLQMGLNTSIGDAITGAKKTKSDVDAAMKKLEKVKGSTTVEIIKNSDGEWKLSTASAAALFAVMSTPVSD